MQSRSRADWREFSLCPARLGQLSQRSVAVRMMQGPLCPHRSIIEAKMVPRRVLNAAVGRGILRSLVDGRGRGNEETRGRVGMKKERRKKRGIETSKATTCGRKQPRHKKSACTPSIYERGSGGLFKPAEGGERASSTSRFDVQGRRDGTRTWTPRVG